MKDAVIVNATAARESGARSVLDQFLSNIPSGISYIVFIDPSYSCESKKGVKLVKIDTSDWLKRIKWDCYGINHWIKRHHINPIAAVSLQNTAFRIKKSIPRYVYFHQAIPFYGGSLNPLKEEQRKLWLYKYVYPFFIKLFLDKETTVFVQLECIKKGFSERFHHPMDKIKVFSPDINQSQSSQIVNLSSETVNLFYPATAQFYKNHTILVRALKRVSHPVRLYTTTYNADFSEETPDDLIVCLGKINPQEIVAWYNSVDALVFPSYLESFGLPLIEAAKAGLPIIAADVTYAREVLSGYEGVQFVNFDDPDAWATAIDGIKKGKRFPRFDISNRPGWRELFQTIHPSL